MKYLFWRGLLVPALALLSAIPAAAGQLKLTMNAGRVTLVADDVPLSQVLQEWSRIGQTRIVNGEKVVAPPVTLQLVDVPEKEALDILLRSASGYITAPRPQLVANASVYDRIMIMPTSRAPAALPVSATAAPPPFQRPPLPAPVDDDDEPVNVNLPPQPGPQAAAPQSAPAFGAFPGAPTGTNSGAAQPNPMLSATPGVVVGAPAGQAGQVAQPGQPGQPNPYQPSVVKPAGPGGGGGA